MKLSTRARYGLRMMTELARALQKEKLVRLRQIAKITGLSENYMAQLAMSLRNDGLLIGVSGKKGGYCLAREPEQITVKDVVQAVQGPISLTDCATHPELCLNAPFCEARMVWVMANYRLTEVFESITLADMIDKDFVKKTRKKHPKMKLLNPDKVMASDAYVMTCPAGTD
jgi:Rrf2 family protein